MFVCPHVSSPTPKKIDKFGYNLFWSRGTKIWPNNSRFGIVSTNPFTRLLTNAPLHVHVNRYKIVVCGSLRGTGFDPRTGHVGFLVTKAALAPSTSVALANCRPTKRCMLICLRTGQLVTDIPSGLSLTWPKTKKKLSGLSLWAKYTHRIYCQLLRIEGCCVVSTEYIYICYVEERRPPLWSSEQSSWLQI
jgi:hypothetical protein